MKSKITLLVGLLSFCLIGFNSCEKKKGCMDKDSVNYDSSAESDDGSCRYEGTVVFWWDQNLTTEFQNNGVSVVKIYVDNQFEGSVAISGQYWNSAPSCGASSTVTSKIDMGVNKSQSINVKYIVVDSNGDAIGNPIEQVYKIAANTCNSIQMQ